MKSALFFSAILIALFIAGAQTSKHAHKEIGAPSPVLAEEQILSDTVYVMKNDLTPPVVGKP